MIQDKIEKLLKKAAPKEEVVLEIPKEKTFGDYSSNLALVLAKKEKKNPILVAQNIIEKLPKADFLEKIEVAPPGFINFYLNDKWLTKQTGEIIKQGSKYGQSEIGKGKKVQVEFISANPTGPLTLGNGRGGFLGDVLANVFEKNGYKVEREYYLNDTGNQILSLGHSVLKDEQAVYKGSYIDEISRKVKEKIPQMAGDRAANVIFEEIIQKDIKKMGIKFDSVKSEKTLVKSSAVKKAIENLKKKGLVYEKDEAVWFSATKFGDDQDRVLVKKTGEYTYFASDTAYHLDKVKRGYDLIFDIWGADHHGDVPRISAIAQVFGFEDKLKIILHQFVRLIENGKTVRMSKRTGTYITLSELIDDVGLDAARYFFLTKAPETHLDFDLKLAKEQSEKNPVYYIQYASARIYHILDKSRKLKLKDPDYNLLVTPSELSLIKHLLKLPDLLEEVCQAYQVQKLPFYALELANLFHNFYEKCRVLSDQKDLTATRLSLVLATQIVLKNTLDILGIQSPEKM